MKRHLFFLLAAFLLVMAQGQNVASQTAPLGIVSTDRQWQGSDFQPLEATGLLVTADGLQLALNSRSGIYLSPVIAAPHGFNVVVPQWVADIPAESELLIRLRTAPAEGLWEPWVAIVENDDWTRPTDEDVVGNMVAVPGIEATHHLVQYEITLRRLVMAAEPRLDLFRLTFIDSTAGPTSLELAAASPAQPDAPAGHYPKPPVVSRAQWCTDPACNYSHGLVYQPVTHLLVHHTVTANSSSNWAAIVRAIWNFHTFTRGWGDIGYNYLVDMNGVIYEGHLGGDDVVGTHAAGANRGSMGVALIGTFTDPNENPPGMVPPAAMQNALIEILAWKADQRNIDVFDAGRLPDLGWGIPRLSGHRDVYGTTTCPGVQAHRLLPALRTAVAARIGFTPRHTYLDELSAGFSKSNANWHDGPYRCGIDGHAWYTYSVTNPAQSTNWAEWRPSISAAGQYEVEVFAPFCNTGTADTQGATYKVYHANGVSTRVVNQRNNLGVWVSLGVFTFNAGNSGYIQLSDLTTTDNWNLVWFDAIRFSFMAPSVNNVSPGPNSWMPSRTVTFNWAVSNTSGVSGIQFQVARDGAFTNLVHSTNLAPAATGTTHTFSQDYNDLFWRVVLSLTNGSAVASMPTYFSVDTTPPTSSVTQVYRFPSGSYHVRWSGNDSGSGVATYTVEYQAAGSGTWTTLRGNTVATAAGFTPPQPGLTYWFRSRAVDRVGNAEAPHASGDRSTVGAPLLNNAIIMPIVYR